YRIVGRREDPVWRVPASIQAEMRARGEPVVSAVGPGPDNPLGKYWIQLSTPGYGLHGTNAPASVGKYASHGCLRLLPEHAERLFHDARDGMAVEVVYEPAPGALSTRIWPPCASTIVLAMNRPSPVPSVRCLSRTRRYFSKRCGSSCAGMPRPVSRTATVTWPLCRPVVTRMTPPAGVYLIAFPIRLSTTRSICDSSATTAGSIP